MNATKKAALKNWAKTNLVLLKTPHLMRPKVVHYVYFLEIHQNNDMKNFSLLSEEFELS